MKGDKVKRKRKPLLPLIGKQYDHWQFSPKLRNFLMHCAAKDDTRYSVAGICADKDKLAVTDGRRLLVLEHQHKIKMGCYYVTKDGFLLPMESKFPKYEEIIPPDDTLEWIIEDADSDIVFAGLLCGKLCETKWITNPRLLLPILDQLEKVHAHSIRVGVCEKSPEDHPMLLRCTTSLGPVTFMQMPLITSL